MFEELEGNMPRDDADLERERNEAGLDKAKQRLAKLESDFYLGEGPSEDRYRELRSTLAETVDLLEARVAVARESIWQQVGTFRIDEFDYEGETLSIRPWWEQASLEEKRALLRSRISRSVVAPDKEAIAKLRGDMTDYQWKKVKNKTELKTAARTTIVPAA